MVSIFMFGTMLHLGKYYYFGKCLEARTSVYAAIAVLILSQVQSELYDCPDGWETYNERCYRFTFYPGLDYESASESCGGNGAYLVSINTEDEHNYVSNWLMTNDLSRAPWYTSGIVIDIATEDMQWKGDGTKIENDKQFWINDEDKHKEGRNIIYQFGITEYGWSRTDSVTLLHYICEISQEEAYQIVQEDRDFDYGVEIFDPDNIEKGPIFAKDPISKVVAGITTDVSIECEANGNPDVIYHIYRQNSTFFDHVTIEDDSRFTISEGRLTILNPDETLDAGSYFCEAENKFGKIIGTTAVLSFGMLNEFPNVPREPVTATAYNYAVIVCDPPSHKPALTYQWMKSGGQFIRPDLNDYLFISHNGNLYFSEVHKYDEDDYYCMVNLVAVNGAQLTTNQPPGGISLGIPLRVIQSPANDWGPEFGDDFIALHPSQPMRGQRLTMECMAFGRAPCADCRTRTPIKYSWRRGNNLPLPLNSELTNHNRVLTIPNIQLEATGNYTCIAEHNTNVAEKWVYLTVSAKPYFSLPLKNQHIDINNPLSWRCEARAVPSPTYSWYKNGIQLFSSDGVQISNNVLQISSVDPELHNGMYQCSASNFHGTSYSSAQLRVLAFQPTFAKYPLEEVTAGSIGGYVTIICHPEAAPLAQHMYQWSKDGVPLQLSDDDTTSRVRKLRNGNLYIEQLVQGDDGTYTCTVENIYGSASSSGRLLVSEPATISRGPTNTEVNENSTAFFFCQASHNPLQELVYVWEFNGKIIDIENDLHYEMGVSHNFAGLYIRSAKYKHSGHYECFARTSVNSVSQSAYLTVLGPPHAPGKPYVDSWSITPTTMKLRWVEVVSNGRPVQYYILEYQTEYSESWEELTRDIHTSSAVDGSSNKMFFDIQGLKPWNGYSFRLRAQNSHGIGNPSLSTAIHQTPGAPPVTAPTEVGGEGGKVGDLTITWKPMNESDFGGDGFGYNIYWRKKGDDRWSKEITTENTGWVVAFVDIENYFLEYEVMVQGFNIHGPGPNSTMEIAYSAEGLPLGVPEKVSAYPYNATALVVEWNPVRDEREIVMGRILGYQVNYWKADEEDPMVHGHMFNGQRSNAMIIGLDADQAYELDVQVYNTAGMGPRSQMYTQLTYMNPPQTYPTEIYVWSRDSESVRVTFRGVSTTVFEEPLKGYKLRYFRTGDDIRVANDVIVGKFEDGILQGIQENTVYNLRILGFNTGGDGKLSPTTYFTLGGSVLMDPETTEIKAFATKPHTSQMLFLMLLMVFSLHNVLY